MVPLSLIVVLGDDQRVGLARPVGAESRALGLLGFGCRVFFQAHGLLVVVLQLIDELGVHVGVELVGLAEVLGQLLDVVSLLQGQFASSTA